MDQGTISFLATVATVTLFLTSGRTVLQIHNNKKTGDVPFIPFLSTFVNCSLWLAYGHLKSQFTVLVVNGIGMSLSLLYMAVFYHYATDRAVLRSLLVYALAFLGFTAVYMYIADPVTRILHLGLFCCCGSMVMFGAPLSTLGQIIKTRDTSSLSFPLCFMNLVVSGLWTLFGLMLNDYFIIVPNGVSVILAVIQLSLFAIFPNKPAITNVSLVEQKPDADV